MRVPREQVSVALFNLLAGNTTLAGLVKTFSRVPQIWTAMPESNKPALILFKGGPDTESFTQAQAIGLTKYILHYNLWLYVTADVTSTIVGETTVNNIADALDGAFQSNAYGERQTLGGLVNNAWIEGASEWGREFEDTNLTVFWRVAVETGI